MRTLSLNILVRIKDKTDKEGNNMEYMHLEYFTSNKEFPFYIGYGEHNSDLFMHSHADFSELTIVLSGTAVHQVNQEEYIIKKGDVFVINKDTSHGYKKLNDFKICNIMFQYDLFFPADYDIKRSAGFHALFMIEPYLAKEQNFQSRLQLNFENFKLVKDIIQQMIQEYEQKQIGYTTLLQGKFLELAVILTRNYNMSDISEKDHVLNISRPISFIEQNYTSQITIQELAAQANLSPRHFTRIFAETYHTTPTKYITILRLQLARTLLRTTDKTVTEIAMDCGYNDSNYFSKQFKVNYLLTPHQYRNQFL